MNAVMWRLNTGAPWRDIPERYGPWKVTYNRFARWAKRGVWERVFKALCVDDDVGSLIDGTVVRAHQDAAGRRGGVRCNHLGRSRGGSSSKIHAITTTNGKPPPIILTPGQHHDSTEASNLIQHATGKALIADAGYDSDALVQIVRARGMKPVIAMSPCRKHNRRRKSLELHSPSRERRALFHDIERSRAIASRYEKTATNLLAAVHVAQILVWLDRGPPPSETGRRAGANVRFLRDRGPKCASRLAGSAGT